MFTKFKTFLHASHQELVELLSQHRLALFIFPILAALFLNEVLFSNKSLSAFDIQLSQPSFSSEIENRPVHQMILGDSPYAHYPERKLNWELFRQGHNFNFTPYIFTGTSYTGKKTGAFITSFPQLFLDIPNAVDWSTWLRLSLAGIFMYFLLVGLGIGRFGALFAGILWTYNLHQIVWLEYPQHLATQLWMPLILLINIRLIQAKEGLPANLVLALLLSNILLYTSGYTQIVLYFYFFIGLFNTLYIGFDRSRPVHGRISKWVTVNGVYLLAMLILAADILSELYDLKTGLRGSQGFRAHEAVLEPSIATALHVFDTLLPNLSEIKRFFSADYLGGIWRVNYITDLSPNIIEGGVYYGVVALFLSFYSITGQRYFSDRRLYFVLLFLIFFFIGFLYGNPLVLGIFNLVPLGGSGTYGRMFTILILLLCILAAFGLSTLVKDLEKKKYLKISAALFIFCLLPVIDRLLDSDEYSLRKFSYAYGVIIATAAVAIIAVKLKKITLVPVAILVISTIDLFAVTYDFNTKMQDARIFPENRTIKFLLNDPQPYRVAVLSKKPIYHHNILSYYSIPTIGGYLTVVSNDYVQFIRKNYANTKVTLNGILFLFNGGNIDFLRQLNVKYLVSDEKINSAKTELVHFNNHNYVYRVLDNLPRVYCASDHIKIDAANKAGGSFTKYIKRFDRPLISDEIPLPAGPLPEDCKISNLQVNVNNVRFNASTSEPAVVTAAYSYHKNWRASINGKPANVYRVNEQLLGVIVPKGNNTVEIHYVNTTEVISSSIKIAFAVIALLVLLTMTSPGAYSILMLAVLLIMIGKNLFTIPGIKNNDIPERSERTDITLADTTGIHSLSGARTSPPIYSGNPYRTSVLSPLNGLKKAVFRISLPEQGETDFDVVFSITDRQSGMTSTRTIPVSQLRGYMWNEIAFDEFTDSKNRTLDIQIAAPSAKKSDMFSVYTDERDMLSLITYHNPVTAYH